jgi:hypothetical protein
VHPTAVTTVQARGTEQQENLNRGRQEEEEQRQETWENFAAEHLQSIPSIL